MAAPSNKLFAMLSSRVLPVHERETGMRMARLNSLVKIKGGPSLGNTGVGASDNQRGQERGGGEGETRPGRSRIVVTPKATQVEGAANWWVKFQDKQAQRTFRHRVDAFSYRFDVVAVCSMSAYCLLYAFVDLFLYSLVVPSLPPSPPAPPPAPHVRFGPGAFAARIFVRVLAALMLAALAVVHWYKSRPLTALDSAPHKHRCCRCQLTPWDVGGETRRVNCGERRGRGQRLRGIWPLQTRSNFLLLDLCIVVVSLHGLDALSGIPWTSAAQYRLLLEVLVGIALRPVEKFNAMCTTAALGVVFPLIWCVITVTTYTNASTSHFASSVWVDPQVYMLPVVGMGLLAVIERLCHYRLLFMALEFVQWRRLQREELEAIFQIGQSLYGSADETMRAYNTQIMSGGIGSTSTAAGGQSAGGTGVGDVNGMGTDGKTSMFLNVPQQQQQLSAAVDDGGGSNSSSKYVVGASETLSSSSHPAEVPLRSPPTTSTPYVTPDSHRRRSYITPFIVGDGLGFDLDHTTPAELAIAKLNKVKEQLDMPANYADLVAEAISIIRTGTRIFEPNVIDQLSRYNLGDSPADSHVRSGSSHSYHVSKPLSPKHAHQSAYASGHGDGAFSELTDKILWAAGSGGGVHSGSGTTHRRYSGLRRHDMVAGPMGASALRGALRGSRPHRDRLVKTATVRDVFHDLDDSSASIYGARLQSLRIDSNQMRTCFEAGVEEDGGLSFNVFDYIDEPREAFVACGILTLHTHAMFQTFRLDETKTLRALRRFAEIYNSPEDVPYHSHLHGCEVAHMTHVYLTSLYNYYEPLHASAAPLVNSDGPELPVVMGGCPLDAVHRFALLLGALVHDLGHPGVNNSFLVETSSPLALQFNDLNVLEMFHVSSAFQVLAQPDCAMLANLSGEERTKIRAVMIDLILATDLADHFTCLGKIQTELDVKGVKNVVPILRSWRPHGLQQQQQQQLAGSPGGTGDGGDSMLQQYRLRPGGLSAGSQSALGKLILKSADIGHPARPREVHLEWSRRATEEFWRQGDRERRLGLPVNAMNDRRETKGLAKGQMGFLSFLVAPTHFLLRTVMGADRLRGLHDNLCGNYMYWAELHAAQQLRTHSSKASSGLLKTPAGKRGVDVSAQAASDASAGSKVGRPSKTPSREPTDAQPRKVFSVKKPPLPRAAPPE